MTIFDDVTFEFNKEAVCFVDHTLPVYVYETREILDLWIKFGHIKGIPVEQTQMTCEERNNIMILFHVWKKLFGFDTSYPLCNADMSRILHVHHFDLLLELYFNYKFRNTAFKADYLD